jgi:hypothetical protein
MRQRISALLDQNHRETLFIPTGSSYPRAEEYSTGWQHRARRLHQAAAEMAEVLGPRGDSSALP